MDNSKENNLKRPSFMVKRNVFSIDIDFRDLTYVVQQGKGKKHVIKGVSGCFKSGELTAIMGPSGAGKSSLLNILTGFRQAHGTIKCTGPLQHRKGAEQHKKHSCYILQDDSLDPLFTVEETMKYAAELKLSRKVSKKSKEALIYEILDALTLLPCRNTRCQMISGGQKKRLSVALELIGNPSVMFLDEPTTGLDSLSASHVISTLKMLAQQGRNIVCTIHQPSASLFEMFDFVYIMADGKSIYQGSSRNVVSYLAASGLNCPQYHNPADYLLEVANGDYGNFINTLEIEGIDNTWRSDSKDKAITPKCDIPPIDEEIGELYGYTDSPSEFYKLWVIMKKSYIKMARDWTISSLKLFLHFFVGVVLGVTYFNAGNDASKMIRNIGYLIITTVYLCYTSLMPAVLKFPSELNILKKEKYNNWYQLRTYYTAVLFVDMPMQIFFVLSYLAGSYWLSAQPLDLYRLAGVILVLFLSSMVASSMGLFFGTIVNPINGTFLGAITLALMLSVAGFLLLFTHMSQAMYLLSYISYISYAMEALAQMIYGYDRVPPPCPEAEDFCLYGKPKDLLKEFGMDKQNYWKDILFLFVNFVTLRVVAFCTLKNTLSKV